MASLADIRAGLAARLSAIPDVQVSPYILANPTPPTLQVCPDGTDYHEVFGPMALWRMKVEGIVSLVSDIGTQERLDRWLAATGSESVKAVIEGDRTLGGIAQDTIVNSSSGYQQVLREGGAMWLTAEWSVVVRA